MWPQTKKIPKQLRHCDGEDAVAKAQPSRLLQYFLLLWCWTSQHLERLRRPLPARQEVVEQGFIVRITRGGLHDGLLQPIDREFQGGAVVGQLLAQVGQEHQKVACGIGIAARVDGHAKDDAQDPIGIVLDGFLSWGCLPGWRGC